MWNDYIMFNVKSDLCSSPHPSLPQSKPKILQQQMLTPTAGKILGESHEVGVRSIFLQKDGINTVRFKWFCNFLGKSPTMA